MRLTRHSRRGERKAGGHLMQYCTAFNTIIRRARGTENSETPEYSPASRPWRSSTPWTFSRRVDDRYVRKFSRHSLSDLRDGRETQDVAKHRLLSQGQNVHGVLGEVLKAGRRKRRRRSGGDRGQRIIDEEIKYAGVTGSFTPTKASATSAAAGARGPQQAAGTGSSRPPLKKARPRRKHEGRRSPHDGPA